MTSELKFIYKYIVRELSQFTEKEIRSYQAYKILQQIHSSEKLKKAHTSTFLSYMSKNLKAKQDITNLIQNQCNKQKILTYYPQLDLNELIIFLKIKTFQIQLIIWIREFVKYNKILFKTKPKATNGPFYTETKRVKKWFRQVFSDDINKFLEGFLHLSSNSEFSYIVYMLTISSEFD